MLLSSSNRKYQPYPLSYFSVVVCLRCLSHHILSLIAYTLREHGILFSLLLCSLWCVQIFGYIWLADRVHLFVHYTISLSSLCKLIWGHWTYKMPVGYILSSVWVRLSIFSQLSIIRYMGLCVFSLHISLVMVERIYTLSYYHHQIRSMNFYPLFRVRSWNNGMPCMSLYILMNVVQYNGKGNYVENRKPSRGAMNQDMIKKLLFEIFISWDWWPISGLVQYFVHSIVPDYNEQDAGRTAQRRNINGFIKPCSNITPASYFTGQSFVS